MNRYTCLSTLALAMLLAAAPASAGMRWGANVFGSWNTVAMGDWNDAIDAANSSGTNYDNIESGFTMGVGPTVMVNDNWSFGAHYERVMPAKSSDETTQIEINTGANVFGASVGYWFPSTSSTRFGIDGSLDYYSLASTLGDPSGDVDIEGTGVGFMFRGVASYAFSPMFAGEFSAGYRLADISIESIGGVDPTGSGLESQDYSGFSLRAGISMSFSQ